jgi:oligopeptide/dipeptide ABC transporter ATP-binding protein
MGEIILKVDHLAVEVGGTEALADVSFLVERGSCLGMVGESGSGKSITCRTLLGLERRVGARVVRGRILIDGIEVAGMDEARWRMVRGRRVALVPQASLDSLDPLMRLGGQLTETLRALEPGTDSRVRALELLEQVEMPQPQAALKSYPHELSGGMRQRAMIALALAARPLLLIADEPTTALDVTVQRRILRLLTGIRKDTGMAMIFVSHDLNVVRSMSDYVTIMYAGRTIETGAVDDIFVRPAHPYTRALIESLPEKTNRAAPLASITGTAPQLGHRPVGCPFRPRCPCAIDVCALPVQRIELGQRHTVECRRAPLEANQ